MDNYILRMVINKRNCSKCETLIREHLGAFTLETINVFHIFGHPEHRKDDTPHIITVLLGKYGGYNVEDHTTQRVYTVSQPHAALKFLAWYNRLGDSISFIAER